MIPANQLQSIYPSNAASENNHIQGWIYHDTIPSSTSLQDAAAAVAASGGIGLPVDSSSPEQFKIIQTILEHINRVQGLTRDVMFGMENAYQPNINANQTARRSDSPLNFVETPNSYSAEEIVALKHAIQSLADVMRQTGIGALPLLPPSTPGAALPFNEDQLLKECSRDVQALYEKSKRSQDSAKIVSDLLGPPPGFGGDQSRR